MYVYTYMYIPIRNVLALFSNFHYDVGRQGIEIYPYIKFHLPQYFSLSIYFILAETFFFVFQEIHSFNHDDVCQVIELYLSTNFHVCHCCG